MANLWFASALLDGGWAQNVRFGIESGRIVRIDTAAAAMQDDERHSLALPGMPNAHSHAFQRAMAGLTEHAGPGADSFWTWRNLMYRFVECLGPDDIEAISAFAFAQMLEAGFTRVGEFHYLHHDRDGAPYADIGELAVRICAAAQESGIGLTLLPVFYAHSNFGNTTPTQGQRRFITSLEQFAKLREASERAVKALDAGRVGVAPHSLRAVAPAELAALVSMAAPGAPLHLHIAEQLKEVADCVAWCGSRPVHWLLDHAPVDGRWCLVHATHVDPEEVHRLAACGAIVGLCPITEANLGDGIFPAAEFLTAGGSFAIGSDSNVLISAAEELRTLEYTQRLAQRRRNVLANAVEQSSGRRLLGAAVAGGAQALGAGPGGLHIGAAADIVSLDTTDVAMTSRGGDALLDSWIFAARGSLIDCVWRQGCKVVSGGRHVRAQAITQRYRGVLARLLARL